MKSHEDRLRWHLCQLKKGYRGCKNSQTKILYLEKIKLIEDELAALNKTETDGSRPVPKLLRQLWKNVTEIHICRFAGNFPVDASNNIKEFTENLKQLLPEYELVKKP